MSDADLGKVIWFELYVDDLKRASAFYGGVLGWEFEPFIDYDPDNYFIIHRRDGSPAGGALVRREGSDAGLARGNGSRVYVEVASVLETLGLVERHGGRVQQPKRQIGPSDGFFGVMEDTEGNQVGIWSAS